MSVALLWPLLTILAAALQIARNAAQRDLTVPLGVWGAAYVRFLFGLPFAIVWCGLVVAFAGPSGGASLNHFLWASLGGVCQAAATALLVIAMRDRAFAVANALQKTEVLGAAVLGLVVLGDQLARLQWAGLVLASLGVTAIVLGGARAEKGKVSFRAGLCGIGAGLFFSISSVSFRAGAHAWGEDPWVGAAATLVVALSIQTFLMGGLIAIVAPRALIRVVTLWRPSLVPGASGAFASAFLFTAFALGPSAGAVKAVQLVDVLLAWAVSSRFYRERLSPIELAGGAAILIGVFAVVFFTL
jgi:drug/metabolite transporter (DMT)-like permease